LNCTRPLCRGSRMRSAVPQSSSAGTCGKARNRKKYYARARGREIRARSGKSRAKREANEPHPKKKARHGSRADYNPKKARHSRGTRRRTPRASWLGSGCGRRLGTRGR
jgi:hypothetical protein